VRITLDDNTVPRSRRPNANGATTSAANNAPSSTRTLNSAGDGCSSPRGPTTPPTHATGSASAATGQRGPA